jgi:hypothetical protein
MDLTIKEKIEFINNLLNSVNYQIDGINDYLNNLKEGDTWGNLANEKFKELVIKKKVLEEELDKLNNP